MRPEVDRDILHVKGLREPAEIKIDRWGIAHIEAGSKYDGFFLQGLNAARDRLWQMDLWRKRGLGILSASFGPGYFEQDKAARAFLYRGDIQAEYLAYAEDMEEICTAFTNGINAWISICEEQPERLPPEFVQTSSRPERWKPEDVVRIRSHALTRNAISEVLRSIIVSEASAEADLLRKNIEPVPNKTSPSGEAVPASVLDIFKLATAGVSFEPGRLDATLEDAGKWRKVTALGEIIQDAEWTGSNNWAVAGSRTLSGLPIIAGDPHRQHNVPSLRYLVHIKTPEFNVIGAGEPIAPGISMGHNETSAFTLTIFGSDQEDIYVYELNPENHLQYRYNGEWEDMRIEHETFDILGYPSQTIALRYTRHGPVLLLEQDSNKAYALKSVWWEAGTCAYLAGVSTMRSHSLDEFKSRVARFGAPALNHVYADVSGTIAWLPYGFTPIRPNWDGLRPVSGNGEHEWQGFVPKAEMPEIINPECGYVSSANEMNLPDSWLNSNEPVGYEWLESSRAYRIGQVLGDAVKHSVEDSCRLQTDTFSWPGMRLQSLLGGCDLSSLADLQSIVDDFLAWNCQLTIDSSSALLQEWWLHKVIKPALFKRFVHDTSYHALMYPGDIEGILRALEMPSAIWGEDPQQSRNMFLLLTFRDTIDALRFKFGVDHNDWKWGNIHHAYFEHALSKTLSTEFKQTADIGPMPKAGSASTVMHAAYRESDFRVTYGASVRLVMDVSDWDNCRCINSPGQSGDPRSPFYRHLFEAWAMGDYVPLLYSDAAIEGATGQIIELKPA